MNANKAIELGFVDDVLTDEKPSDGIVPAYAFSRKTVQAALLNKINAKTETSKPKENEQEPEAEPKAAEPQTPHGRPYNDLMERLNLIKPN